MQLDATSSPLSQRSLFRRWVYALKPASWPKLLVPACVGSAIGVASGPARAAGVLFALAFTICELVFLVLLNDWFDRDVDALKRRMFPNVGSPKTIPDGILPGRHLLAGGVMAGVAALGLAVFGEARLTSGLLPASIACLSLFVAYSIPPVRLNYRGGGELLEMLGVGVALPWLAAFAVCGSFAPRQLVVLVGFTPLCLASAIASGLSDEQSDRAGGKHTFVTRFGNQRARRLLEALVVLGIALWIGTALVARSAAPPLATACAALVASMHWPKLRRASGAAVTNAFSAQTAYKGALHHAIWRSGLALAVTLVVFR